MLPPKPCSSPFSGPRPSFNFLDCPKHLATNASATGHGHHCTAASSTKGQHRTYSRLGCRSRVLLPNANFTPKAPLPIAQLRYIFQRAPANRVAKELQDSLYQPASRTRRPPTPPLTAARAVPKPKPRLCP